MQEYPGIIELPRRSRNTDKLPCIEEVQRDGQVPVLIDPFEPRIPKERSLEKPTFIEWLRGLLGL